MNYQTFQPHPELETWIKCYWSLAVPAEPNPQKQRILPDGCIEMIFILGDDIKRFTSANEFLLQPRAMVLGQISEPFYVEPTGDVNTFAIRFYPYGFAGFTTIPVKALANKETPIRLLFGEKTAADLTNNIINAADTQERITIAEKFLLHKLKDKTTIDSIVKSTVDTILHTKGVLPINNILKGAKSKRRQLERNFAKQVGLSPKQLGKVIRLQATLKMLLHRKNENLTKIAYDNQYFDQAHFIKDFKEFTGTTPKDFYKGDEFELSVLFYTNE